jgi:DNA-nicking Smr family endonuclease
MSKKTPPSDDEIALFRKMMADVTPLKGEKRQISPKKKTNPPKKPGNNKLHHKPIPRPRPLSDGIDFDIHPEDTINYFANGFPIDRRKKLVKGLIPIESRIDLHELNRDSAHHRLDSFITTQYQKGIRCVLVIHGKGKGTLKNLIARWLTQYHEVLAYHSAIPRHGGTGAVYVYLRRP